MSKLRALLKSSRVGVAGKAHGCKSNQAHRLAKGDRMLILKVERDNFHYCLACAENMIDVARSGLDELVTELRMPVTATPV